MHLVMLAIVISASFLSRLYWQRGDRCWTQRWKHALAAFLLPPLCLITTAIAILCMGTHGHMMGLPVGYWGYLMAIGWLSVAVVWLIYLGWQTWRSLLRIQALPPVSLDGCLGYQLETDTPFAAQIGFWSPKLVVSQGLMTQLTPQHLDAVLAHEQAHLAYHDTFWFFCLGWIRRLTYWLPKTHELWQELLLLRELRADRWAAERVDSILLAEALLTVVQHQSIEPPDSPRYSSPPDFITTGNQWVAFDPALSVSRLEERVEALVNPPKEFGHFRTVQWLVPITALIPLLTIGLHH